MTDRMARRRPPVPPHQRPHQPTSCGSTRTGRSATCTSARRSPTGRSYRHLGPDPFAGFANRVGEPIPLAYPTTGTGDFRVPALVGPRARRRDRALALATSRHAIRRPASPALDGLPSTYVEADEEAETLDVTLADERSRHRGRPAVHDLPRPPVHRPERHDPQRRHGARRGPDRAMSASLDLPDADWVLIGLSRRVGAREPRRRAAAASGPAVGRRATRGASSAQHNPFLALRRPTTDEAHGEAYGFSLVYSGNFLAEAEVDAVRHDPGPDRHRARHLRAGRSSRATRSRRPRR